jgi:hypothetical protein
VTITFTVTVTFFAFLMMLTHSPHAAAMIVSVVGIVGLAVILWLMRFKPF